MSDKIRKAYSEVYEILQLLDSDFLDKIPEKFIKFLEKEKDNNYIANINPNLPLEEQNLLTDTINILAMLKLDYWCTDELEKKELLTILNKNEENYQAELRKKYNPDDIFKKENNTQTNIEQQETSLVIVKEKNIILKLFEKIKNMFKRKTIQ